MTMRTRSGLFFFTAAFAILCPAIGCGGKGQHDQNTNPPTLASISVTPSGGELVLGANQAFTATGKYSDGTSKDLTAAVQWSAADSTILWLNNSTSRKGLATPRGSGSTTVKAAYSGITGTASATVTALSPRYGFVVSQDQTLSRFVLDASTGSMRSRDYLYLGPSSPVAAVTDGAGKVLFFVDAQTDSVWAYVIDAASGKLTAAAGSPFPSGAGSSGLAVDPQGRILYVANQRAGKVTAFAIDAGTGTLASVAGSPFTAGSGTSALALDPTGHFLYAANRQDNTVSAFAIGTGGALSPVADSPFSTGQGPGSLAVDPSGQYLYVANTAANTISAHAIDAATGALKAVAGSPFSAGNSPVSLAVEPGGQYLYAANRGNAESHYGGTVSAFEISPDTGALTALASSPAAGNAPAAVSADPSGSLLYVVNQDSNDVWTFGINHQTGVLSLMQTTRTRMAPVSMAVASGKNTVSATATFAYAAGPAASSVGAYSVSASTGALTEIQGSPFATAGASISVTLHPSGKYLYVSNFWNYKVSGYTIDSTSGALTPVPGSPYAYPSQNSGPYKVVAEPSGRFIYMTNSYDLLAGMAVDQDTGALSPSAWNPVRISEGQPWGPNDFVIDPAGRFLYVADSSWGSISAYAIDRIDGSLTEVPGSPVSAGSAMGNYPQSLTVDPTGKHLYLSLRCATWAQTCSSNALFGFSIDAGDGRLTALQGSPWETPMSDIVSMTMDARGRFLYIIDGGGSNVGSAKGTYGYAMDPWTGKPNLMAAFPFQPAVVAFLSSEPTGGFIYAGNMTSNQIETYTINPSTGALTQTQGLASTLGGAPWSIAVRDVLQ